ncbi:MULTISPECIES: glycosyltransferase [unclassified Acinetobacter]|uniref:glycosyltransferase n=1 Tax=unclassified Acinetobacter TaxID=196816 RepID=UPI0018AA39D2|nr:MULTISPECIES: glycosyltransferase [unclassified Acinetobacter]MBJ9952872.1 glycosyl transferase [Acinetobacter baumannii]
MISENIKIFVGCDPNNCDLEQLMVLEHSVRKHTQHNVEFIWMQLSHDINSPWYSDQETNQGWSTAKWATPFSGFRWAIPELCDFKGRAIYMDADVVVLCDIAELWSHPMTDEAIVIAKGGKSSARLCTCVWDCAKAKEYLPSLDEIRSNPDSHKNLMRLIKEKPQLVEPYQDSYNNIDGEDLTIEQIKVLHYSDMGTQFSHKYAIPRLAKMNQKHWFDGKIMPHPRQDLIKLFDEYYAEALKLGYKPENYLIEPYGTFSKATQINYQGNKVTRPDQETNWFNKQIRKIKAKFKKPTFTLDG